MQIIIPFLTKRAHRFIENLNTLIKEKIFVFSCIVCGLLPGKEYVPVIAKAWAALVSSVHADGKLGNVQQIGAQPESVDSNSTKAYGTGAFLLAGW
ncbi:MAG: glycoside hydrolase family 88 protein [Ginsengibacter sp.]